MEWDWYNEKQKRNFCRYATFLALLLFSWAAITLNPTEGRKDYDTCVKQAINIQSYQTVHISDTIKSGAELSWKQKREKAEADSKYLENRATCNDLKAQWSMAVIAYWGLLTGLLGLAAIMGTLWQTFKASQAATNTLKIAKIASSL